MKEMTPEGKAAELYPQMDAYGKTLAKRAAFIEGAQWQASQSPTHEAVAVAYHNWVQDRGYETFFMGVEGRLYCHRSQENLSPSKMNKLTDKQLFTLFTASPEYKELFK